MSLLVLREVERALARKGREELIEAIRTEDETILDPEPAEVLSTALVTSDRRLVRALDGLPPPRPRIELI